MKARDYSLPNYIICTVGHTGTYVCGHRVRPIELVSIGSDGRNRNLVNPHLKSDGKKQTVRG